MERKPDPTEGDRDLSFYPVDISRREALRAGSRGRQGQYFGSELHPPTLFNPRKIFWPFSFRSRSWLQDRFFLWVCEKIGMSGNLEKVVSTEVNLGNIGKYTARYNFF